VSLYIMIACFCALQRLHRTAETVPTGVVKSTLANVMISLLNKPAVPLAHSTAPHNLVSYSVIYLSKI